MFKFLNKLDKPCQKTERGGCELQLSPVGVFRRDVQGNLQYGARLAVPNKEEDGRRFAMTSS